MAVSLFSYRTPDIFAVPTRKGFQENIICAFKSGFCSLWIIGDYDRNFSTLFSCAMISPVPACCYHT